MSLLHENLIRIRLTAMASGDDSQHLALLGTRGIPAAYGGFETFAEELATRFVKEGYTVTVYCRYYFFTKKPKEKEFKGVRLCYIPTFKQKFLDTPVHSLLSFLHVLRCSYSVVLLCNAANSPFAWIAKLKGLPLYINVDGIERKRAKWNFLGRAWYILGEWSSVLFATRVVADAQVIAEYYAKTYSKDTEVIAYGAKKEVPTGSATLDAFELKKGRYILYVSRLEPENNALCVIEAYGHVDTDIPLVVVGDAPYSAEYIAELYAKADRRVVFTGFQFGEAYRELRAHCLMYVQATEVGGTHPALVEGMAYGNCIIANDVPEHREVLDDCGEFYAFNNVSDLALSMSALLEDSARRDELSKKAKERADELFTWDEIMSQYRTLLFN